MSANVNIGKLQENKVLCKRPSLTQLTATGSWEGETGSLPEGVGWSNLMVSRFLIFHSETGEALLKGEAQYR
jgi:hypothetical protein